MPAAVFSLTGAGSEKCWQTYAAGIYRSRVMSGEDWDGGVTIEKPIPTAAQDCASREWYELNKAGSKLKLHVILKPGNAGKATSQSSRSTNRIFNIIWL